MDSSEKTKRKSREALSLACNWSAALISKQYLFPPGGRHSTLALFSSFHLLLTHKYYSTVHTYCSY